MFHNPRALRPLPRECFGPLNQHFFEDGQMLTYCGTNAVLSSFTMILQVTDCAFHVMVGTVSTGWWAVIPCDRGQSFHRMVGAHSS